MADGAASAEVAADADPAENQDQRQMAGQMTMSVWHLLTQRYHQCQSDARNKIRRLRRRKLHRWVQRKLRAWTRRLRAWTWPGWVCRRGWDPSQKVAGPDEGQADLKRLFFFNMLKEDIICCDA